MPAAYTRASAHVACACARAHGRTWAAALGVMVALIVLAALPQRSVAASDVPEARWTTDGAVNAVATDANGDTYIGGDFTIVGPATGGGARLSATGAGDSADPTDQGGVDGTISAAVADGSGGYFIGGTFTAVGGQPRSNIAHVLADGSVDGAWNPGGVGANGAVTALALSGSDLFVGGSFTAIGGQSRTRIAKVLASGSGTTDVTWTGNGGVDNTVTGLATIGTTVYAIGTFLNVVPSYTTRWRAAAFSTTGAGALTGWNPQPNNTPYAIAASGTSLYIGGLFNNIGAQTRYGIGRVDGTSGAADSWNANATGTNITALAVSGPDVYVGGTFTIMGGQNRANIAKVSGTTALADAGWNPGTNGAVNALAVAGGRLFVGGAFTTVGAAGRNRLANLDAGGTGTVDASWNPGGTGANAAVSAVAADASTVYAGGTFVTIGGVSRTRIAKIDTASTGLVDPTWNPGGVGANGSVTSLVVSGSSLFAGGAFGTMGGLGRTRLAKISTTGAGATDASWVAGGGGVDNTVTAIAVSGTSLYAVGAFLNILPSYTTRWRGAAFNTTSGALTGWNPQPNNTPYSIATYGTSVYVGGLFTNIGGQNRGGVGRVDGSSGTADGWNPNGGGTNITALHATDAGLYIGGAFTSMGGQSRANIAKVDHTTALADLGWNPGTNGAVASFASVGNVLYVGGAFTTIGGQARERLAKLDGINTGAVDATWDPSGTNGSVDAIATSGERVYIGGAFTRTHNFAASAAQFGADPLMEIETGPKVSVTPGQATIWWYSSDSGSSELRWGTSADSWSALPNDVSNTATDLGTLHSRTISNLAAGTYYFRVRSTGTAGTATSVVRKVVVTAGDAATPMATVSFNDTVRATAASADGSTLYVGGQFTGVGTRVGAGFGLNTTSGTAGSGLPQFVGSTKSVVADGAGGYYVGGSFVRVGGLERKRLAHILPDGGIDPHFDIAADGDVTSIARSGTRLYVGGTFATLDGAARSRIAEIDLSGIPEVTTWNPGASATPRSLVVSGTTLFVGGDFTTIAGQSRSRAAAFDTATGGILAWNPNVSGTVFDIAVSGSSVYVAGSFTTVNGATTRNRVAELDATTGVATAWNPNLGATARTIDVSGGVVYVGGDFTTVNGATVRNYAAAFPVASSTASAWNPNFNNTVNTIAASGGSIIVGGAFTVANGATVRERLAATNTTNGTVTAWNPRLNNSVLDVTVSGTTAYVVGFATAYGLTTRNGAAAIDVATGTVTSWNPNFAHGTMAIVYEFLVSGTTIYAGGQFTSVNGGTVRNNLVALNDTTGTATAWNPNVSAPVFTMAISGTTLFIGGQFGLVNGSTARLCAAALSTTTGTATSWNPALNNSVVAMEVAGGNVYVGGWFTTTNSGATTRNHLASFVVGGVGTPTAWNPNVTGGNIYSMEVGAGSSIYVGGDFTTVNGTTRNNSAEIDTTTGVPTAWAPNTNAEVDAIARVGSTVHIGGGFTTVQGAPHQAFATVDATTGAPNQYDVSPSHYVWSITPIGSRVYVGGQYGSASAEAFANLGLFWIDTGQRADLTDSGGLTISQAPQHNVAPYQATVWWTTSGSSSSELVWDRFSHTRWTDYPYDVSNTATSLGTVHSRTISNLPAGTYFYRVRSRDASGNQVTSAERSFVVSAPDAATPLGSLVLNDTATTTALSADGTTAYLGGDFTHATERGGSGMDVSLTTGTTAPGVPQVAGRVDDAVADGLGGWYVAGDTITAVGGLTRSDLTHILPDGGVDPTFDVDTNFAIRSMVVSGSTLIVGGTFTTIAGQSRTRLAAFDIPTGTLTSFNPGASGVVNELLLDGPTLYVAGNFATIGGQSRSNLAAITVATVAVTAWNPAPNGEVQSIATDGTTVYAGGLFTTIGGQSRYHVGAVGAGSGLATSFAPTTDMFQAFSLALNPAGTILYIAGAMNNMGGSSRSFFAAVDIATSTATAWNPALSSTVYDLERIGTTLYMGGTFARVGAVERQRVAAFDIGTNTLTSFDPSMSGAVTYALGVAGGRMFVGGALSGVGGATRNRIAAIDIGTGELTAFNPNATGASTATVSSIVVDGSTLFVGGNFTNIGGQARTHLAALNATTGAATTWSANTSFSVSKLVLSGSTLYVGGQFTTIGGQSRTNLAAVDTSTATVAAWNPAPNLPVRTMAAAAGVLYVGGDFTSIAGQSRNRAAAFDSANTITAWNPDVNNAVLAIAASSTYVYIGGFFSTVGGAANANMARVTLTTGAVSPFIAVNNGVRALAVDGSDLWIGGEFTTVAGSTRRGIAVVAEASGSLGSFAPRLMYGSSSLVGTTSFTITGETVLIGSSAVSAGEVSQSGFALFNTCDRSDLCVHEGLRDHLAMSLDSSTVTMNGMVAGVSAVGTTQVLVRTNATDGYTIAVSDASDTAALTCSTGSCSGQSIADWTGTDSAPTPWATADTGTEYGFGVTMLTTTLGAKAVKWGTGVTATDYVNNRYAGVRSAPIALHTIDRYLGSTSDLTTLAWRARVGNQTAGAYAGTMTVTAIPNA